MMTRRGFPPFSKCCRRPVALWRVVATFAIAVPASGCSVNSDAFFESVGGTTGPHGPDSDGGDVPTSDSGADETGEFPPDAVACDFESVPCTDDVECCVAAQPPGVLVPGACPNVGYPFNWSCDSSGSGGECVHENGTGPHGCDSHADCSELIENYVCVIAGGSEPGRCAPSCAGSLTCSGTHALPDSFTCQGIFGTALGDVSYCRQSTN